MLICAEVLFAVLKDTAHTKKNIFCLSLFFLGPSDLCCVVRANETEDELSDFSLSRTKKSLLSLLKRDIFAANIHNVEGIKGRLKKREE